MVIICSTLPLHTLNNTIAKRFIQTAPPARTFTVAPDMSKAFDTVNIHPLIGKLLQTCTPCTVIKFIANYIKGSKAYTTYRNNKTTCTLVTPDPAEYNSNLGLNTNNKAIPMALHPKVLGLTLDPKLTYNAHIQNIATLLYS